MSNFVSVYANGKKGDPVVTVTEEFARSIKATVLENEPAVDTLGRPLAPREEGAYENPPEPNFAPAIQLPEGFVPKDQRSEDQEPTPDGATGASGATGPTGATAQTGSTGATGSPHQMSGATAASANTPTGGPAGMKPEEASK